MSLDLVSMAAEVESIAEKATKEAHQETSLMVLQSTWDRIEFSATTTTETDTPLISMTEEDLEVNGGSWPIFRRLNTLGLFVGSAIINSREC